MKLTKNQLNVIYSIYEDRDWSENTSKAHKNTLNSLYKRGLITLFIYENGGFWSLTDSGLDIYKNIK